MAKAPPVSKSPPTAEELADAESYGVADLGQNGANGHPQIQTWRRQDAFLALYSEAGTMGLCARRAGVHRESVRRWTNTNLLAFVPRLRDTLEVFVDRHDERLSEFAFDVTNKNPLAIIAKLNAYRPERYKRETVVADNRTVEALSEIKKLMVAEAERRALVAGDGGQTEQARAVEVIEGKSRVVSDDMDSGEPSGGGMGSVSGVGEGRVEARVQVGEDEGVWLRDDED